MLSEKRVLVVEDDVEIGQLLKTFLNEMGVSTVYQAADGFEAIQFMDSKRQADLVICDWNMPGMSGLSVLRQLKITHPDMPFIMVTSRSDYESIRLVKELGLQAYLIKPVTIEQLQRKVVSVLTH